MTSGPDAEETAKFVEMADKFFDCMNVDNLNEGKGKQNKFWNYVLNKSGSVMILLLISSNEKISGSKKGYSDTQKPRNLLNDLTSEGISITCIVQCNGVVISCLFHVKCHCLWN